MMLLTDEEISATSYKHFAEVAHVHDNDMDWDKLANDFARAIEAAILAKLASAELPEPATVTVLKEIPYYTYDQLCEAYAQGAAAQLATCKNCLQVELLLKDMLDTLPYNTPEYWIERIRGALSLYTRRQA